VAELVGKEGGPGTALQTVELDHHGGGPDYFLLQGRASGKQQALPECRSLNGR
jgi:hypothetical protein